MCYTPLSCDNGTCTHVLHMQRIHYMCWYVVITWSYVYTLASKLYVYTHDVVLVDIVLVGCVLNDIENVLWAFSTWLSRLLLLWLRDSLCFGGCVSHQWNALAEWLYQHKLSWHALLCPECDHHSVFCWAQLDSNFCTWKNVQWRQYFISISRDTAL